MNEMRTLNIGIVTPWVSHVSINFLLNLKEIISSISNRLHIVAGHSKNLSSRKDFECTYIHKIVHKRSNNSVSRIINYILLEMKISCKILRLKNEVDVWIFFKGGESLLIPGREKENTN